MTWLRTDDGFPEHPKCDALAEHFGDDWQTLNLAFAIWHHMGCDCAARRTDGVFNVSRAYRVVRAPRSAIDSALAGLVKVGLLERRADCLVFHDWAQYQPTRAQLDAEREAKNARQARWREGVAKTPEKKRGVDDAVDASTRPSVDGDVDASGDGRVDGAPSRPVPTRPVDQSTPNGVLPPQPLAGASTAVEKTDRRKPSRPDDAPPAEGSPAAAVVAAVECAGFLRGLVKRPYALGNAAVAAFPGVDLAAQVAKANGWCVMNPAKAPRSNGDAFLWRWLQTAQNDVANRAAREGQRSAAPDLFAPKAAPVARAVNANDLRREHQALGALPMRIT